MAPFSDFDRSSNPESRNTSSTAWFSGRTLASMCRNPFAPATAASRSAGSCRVPCLETHRRREGGLGGAVAEVEIGAPAMGRSSVQQASATTRRLMHRVARVAESVDERLGQDRPG